MSSSKMDDKAVNVVKGLCMDAIRKANSGHPGGAMSSADFAYVLYRDYLNYDPENDKWFNRDRFVLSCGHESSLQYALLYMAGFLDMDDLKNFRQLGSRTPGHPEVDVVPGVEATTGPLGQGVANSVGMAVAEAFLRENLGEDICSHYTYTLASDGDLQEPVALGAASLAGLWGLGKLIVFYDSNKIQLAGPTCQCDCMDYKKVFKGMGWDVKEVDGHDRKEIAKALDKARDDSDKPTLIIGHTTMAKGAATLEGSHKTHGSPMSPEEIAATKDKMGLPADEQFYCPEDVLEHFRARQAGLKDLVAGWEESRDAMLAEGGDKAAFWAHALEKRSDLKIEWPEFTPGETIATRKAWGACLDKVTSELPTLMGGSADLDPSNQTVNFRQTTGEFGCKNPGARNLVFGVREFPMAAILNGMALHGGTIPFGATFLTFSDYCRNAIRMSALQELPVIYIFTHDSFYVGEDGPTHQPVEHVSSLRLIPNVNVLRPADATETAVCLDMAFTSDKTPSCVMLTRQGLPVMDKATVGDGPRKGGYVVRDCESTPEMIIVASGSEVSLAMEAADKVADRKIRVVSMPSMEIFDAQDEEYKASVLPAEVTNRVAVEAGPAAMWYKYVGLSGAVLSMEHFGESAPAGLLAKKYGFTADNLAGLIRERF